MTSFTDLKSILRILKKRLWLLILVPILCSGTMFMLSKFVFQKQYSASSTIYVIGNEVQQGKSLAYDDILLGQVLVKDYRELINQRTVIKQVIDELNLNRELTAAALSKMISVDLKIDTRIIEIKVTDKNPVLTAIVANKLAEVFAKKAVDIMKVRSVEIVDTAEMPTSPVKPTPYADSSIAFLVGIVLALAIVFLLELFDDSVKNADMAEKLLNLPVLGNITNFKYLPRNGKKDMVKYEAYNFFKANVQHILNKKQIKTIMVTSAVIEEGKSTTAANLAIFLAKHGKKTLLVDCNMRRPKIQSLFFKGDKAERINENGLSKLLKTGGDFNEFTVQTDISGLYLIPAGTISQNPDELIETGSMKEFIEKAEQVFDVVIFDAPSVGVVADGITLSTFCDGVLFVIGAEKTSIVKVKQAIESLGKVDADILGVVLNKSSKAEMKSYLRNIKEYYPKDDSKGLDYYKGLTV